MGLPPLYPLIMGEFGLSYVQVGLLVTALYLSRVLLTVPFGYISDKTGLKSTIIPGLFVSIVGLLLVGVAERFDHLFLFLILTGIASSIYHSAGPALIARSLPKIKGKALGIEGFGGSTGSALGPLLTGITGILFGWRVAINLLAVLVILISFVFWKFIKEPARRITVNNSSNNLIHRGSFITLPILSVILAFSLRGIFWRGVSSFIPLYLVNLRLVSVELAAVLFAILMASGAFGMIFGGAFSDRIGRRRVIVPSTLCGVLLILIFLNIPTAFLGFTLCLLGLLYFSGTPAIKALLADVTPPSDLAKAFGLTFTMTYSVALVAPPVLGYFADIAGLEVIFYSISVLLIIVTILFLVTKFDKDDGHQV